MAKGEALKKGLEWAVSKAKPVIEDVLELFPGYDAAHKARRLENFAAKSVVRKPVTSSRDTAKKPLKRVYHATRGDFKQFEAGRPTKNYMGDLIGPVTTERHANFFAEDPRFAQEYITEGRTGKIAEGGNIMPAYLNAQNPFPLTDDALSQLLDNGPEVQRLLDNNIDVWNIYRYFDEPTRWELFDSDEGREFVDNLRRSGYDSAFLREEHPEGGLADVWAVFDPTQIKSAIGNRGSFDPMDPDITKAKGGLAVKPVWDKKRPKDLGKPKSLSVKKKKSAKARAAAAGRPYPNLIDNMAVARKKGK